MVRKYLAVAIEHNARCPTVRLRTPLCDSVPDCVNQVSRGAASELRLCGLSLRRRCRNLITGYADSETERRAAQIGVWRVLPKPLQIELLLPLVQRAAEQPVLLLVDDDADFCAGLRDVLASRDCRVAIAHSSVEALTRFHTQNFQAVIVDWRLPDIDGLRLLQQIRDEQPNVHSVLITGHRPELNSRLDVTAMTQANVLFYKPLEVEPFLESLFRLMSC